MRASPSHSPTVIAGAEPPYSRAVQNDRGGGPPRSFVYRKALSTRRRYWAAVVMAGKALYRVSETSSKAAPSGAASESQLVIAT
jgi:hypothetical protein